MSYNSSPEDARWVPSMPNSDIWTLGPSGNIAGLIALEMCDNGPLAKRFVPLRSSPLRRFPPVTAASLVAVTGSVTYTLLGEEPETSSTSTGISTSPSAISPPRSRAIGLGHPSTSERCHLGPNSSTLPRKCSQPRSRITSSRAKYYRTGRFLARNLDVIEVVDQKLQSSLGLTRMRTRGRSCATTVSAIKTRKTCTGRRVTPPSPSPPTPASLTPSLPASPRYASMNDTSVPYPGPVPRHTSSGYPRGGPMQVQSPRLLFPASMAGSPLFQSLDGAAQSIAIVAMRNDQKSETQDISKEFVLVEDGLLKLKYHTKFKLRFAARRLKMLF